MFLDESLDKTGEMNKAHSRFVIMCLLNHDLVWLIDMLEIPWMV